MHHSLCFRLSVRLNLISKNIPSLSDICSDVDLSSHHTHLSDYAPLSHFQETHPISSSSSAFLALFFLSLCGGLYLGRQPQTDMWCTLIFLKGWVVLFVLLTLKLFLIYLKTLITLCSVKLSVLSSFSMVCRN